MERNIYFLVVERTAEGKYLAKVAAVPEGMNLARNLTENTAPALHWF